MAKRYAKLSKEKKKAVPKNAVAKKQVAERSTSKGTEYVSFRTAKDLAPWNRNPRTITKEQLGILEKGLKEFGDLSGVVYNRRLGALLGGHQRIKTISPEARITITKAYPEATPTGTVAEGFIELNGERFSYREVEMDFEQHAAAAILANKAGGDWNWSELKDITHELDAANFDLELTGFSLNEIESLMTYAKVPDAPADSDRKTNPNELAQGYADAAVKKIELWIMADQYEEIITSLKRIGTRMNLETNTEIIMKLIEDADT